MFLSLLQNHVRRFVDCFAMDFSRIDITQLCLSTAYPLRYWVWFCQDIWLVSSSWSNLVSFGWALLWCVINFRQCKFNGHFRFVRRNDPYEAVERIAKGISLTLFSFPMSSFSQNKNWEAWSCKKIHIAVTRFVFFFFVILYALFSRGTIIGRCWCY